MFRMIYQEMLPQNIFTGKFSGTHVTRILLLLFDTFGFANFSVDACLLMVMLQRLGELPPIEIGENNFKIRAMLDTILKTGFFFGTISSNSYFTN